MPPTGRRGSHSVWFIAHRGAVEYSHGGRPSDPVVDELGDSDVGDVFHPEVFRGEFVVVEHDRVFDPEVVEQQRHGQTGAVLSPMQWMTTGAGASATTVNSSPNRGPSSPPASCSTCRTAIAHHRVVPPTSHLVSRWPFDSGAGSTRTGTDAAAPRARCRAGDRSPSRRRVHRTRRARRRPACATRPFGTPDATAGDRRVRTIAPRSRKFLTPPNAYRCTGSSAAPSASM